MNWKIGDVISYSPVMSEESHAIITAVNETGIDAWDFEYGTYFSLTFDRDKPGNWFGRTSKRNLDMSISFETKTRQGSFTVRQLAEEAAAQLGITAIFKETNA